MNEEGTNRDIVSVALDTTDIAALDLLDPREVDWGRVQRTAYLVHQHLRYEYPGPIEDLVQRLVIIPPDHYGDQRRIVHRLEVSAAGADVSSEQDAFDNLLITVRVPRVEHAISFEAWIVVERNPYHGPQRLPASALAALQLHTPSRLTAPDDALRQTAAELAAGGAEGVQLATRIDDAVYEVMSYAHDVTDIHTTAAQAWALKQGVCQDYAHVMIALCRLCGLPARYVSGHLLGEGGTHAWVEVLLPADDGDALIAWPFDPTHGRQASLRYLTIAIGRDYYDVAPTSGTFRASFAGRLSAHKRVDLTAVEYAPGGRNE